MRSQLTKDIYYNTFARLSMAVYAWYRLFGASRFDGAFLNIGCGPKYMPGMVNVDGNIFRKKDLWLDVTIGLPFPDSSIRGVYASHVLEHFDAARARKLLAECYRVLKPGAALRLVVPSLEYAIRAYNSGDGSQLPDWPESRQSIGGRFNNFLLCANQHSLMLDFSFLEELLRGSGFSSVHKEDPQRSSHFSREQMQFELDPSLKDVSIYVEAVK
jgi:predicted SAM-dependent methyltransferase